MPAFLANAQDYIEASQENTGSIQKSLGLKALEDI